MYFAGAVLQGAHLPYLAHRGSPQIRRLGARLICGETPFDSKRLGCRDPYPRHVSTTTFQRLGGLLGELTNAIPNLDDELKSKIVLLKSEISTVARSWSGSQLGHQSLVYYRDFKIPPPGARFNIRWGLQKPYMETGTIGDWVEYSFDDVTEMILKKSGSPNLELFEGEMAKISRIFLRTKDQFDSILATVVETRSDTYIASIVGKSRGLKLSTLDEIKLSLHSDRFYATVDSVALSQGVRLAPHEELMARIQCSESCIPQIEILKGLAEGISEHLRNLLEESSGQSGITPATITWITPPGRKIFIGHGHSLEWFKLRDFLSSRLGFECDDFDRVPTAGISNEERLSTMLNDAVFACLIMTAEDEAVNGDVRARENVVHEAGLFQGKLGFKKAIVFVEESCSIFSNIDGLGQIRFPRGQIEAKFEELRRVLERENLLPRS